MSKVASVVSGIYQAPIMVVLYCPVFILGGEWQKPVGGMAP